MGGGGSYYDRDVTDRGLRSSSGFSSKAEEAISRRTLDKAMDPKDRTITCNSRNPVVIAFDETGSMGSLPKIIYDKMPMIAGQILEKQYLRDPMISVAAVGDQFSDTSPIQIGEFSFIKNLDEWLQRIFLEGLGGGQCRESYELTAYFYATKCEMPNAKRPIFIFIGDEDFYENIYKKDLVKHFGGEHQGTTAKDTFNQLKNRFKGNVFLVHRRYQSGGVDKDIVRDWKEALGDEKVVILPEDLAIADVILGIIALAGGKRTLEGYLEDMRTRKNQATGALEPQTEKRIAEVRKSLEVLAGTIKTEAAPKAKASAKQTDTTKSPEKTEPKTGTNKVGRL